MKKRIVGLVRLLPLILVRIAGAVLAGALAVYVARTEGAEYSGEFFVLVSTLTIVSVLTRLGAEPYLTSQISSRVRAGTRTNASYLASTLVAVGVIVVLAGLLISLLQVAAPSVSRNVTNGLPPWLLIAAVLGLNSMWIVTGYCRSVGMAATSIFLETGMTSLWLLANLQILRLASLEATPARVATVIFVLGPLLLAPLVPMFIRHRRDLLTTAGVVDSLKGTGSFGAVTVTNGIIILIPLQTLGWYGLDHEAGVYNAALRLSMFVGAFGVIVKSLIIRNEFRRESGTHNRRKDVVVAGLTCLPWVALSIILSWQSDLFVSLFGPDFSDLREVLPIMLLAQAVNVAGFPIETRAVLANERALLNVTSVTTLLFALVTAPILVNRYGLTGAAVAFAATILTTRILLAWLYLRNAPHDSGSMQSQMPPAREA